MTVPAPVWIPQPSGPSVAMSSEGSTFTTEFRLARVWEANDDWPKKCEPTRSPLASAKAELPSSRPPAMLYIWKSKQLAGRSALHAGQFRHEVNDRTTWSPGATWVTADPTASTTPAPSWPYTVGPMKNSGGSSRLNRSVWHMPAATMRTTTSSSAGSASVSSSMVNGPWPSRMTAALICTCAPRTSGRSVWSA